MLFRSGLAKSMCRVALIFAVAMLANRSADAVVVRGTGAGSLIGGDLTDPENNGAADANTNYNAIFGSDNEPGFGGGEFSFNAFDNQVGGGNAKWCCDDPNPGSGTLGPGHQLTAQINAGQHILNRFTITSSNDSAQRDPLIWEIQGSNDGVSFTTIHRQEGVLWSARNQVLEFQAGTDFNVPGSYEFFRYSVTSTGSGAHALGEIEYLGTPGLNFEVGGNNTLGNENYTGSEQSLVTTPLANARVVRITQMRPDNASVDNPLQFAEIRAIENGTLTNQALASNGGVASQTSTNGGFVAGNAIDGNNANFQHTNVANDFGQSWQVTLSASRTLDSVDLLSRQDCCGQARSSHVRLDIFSDVAATNLIFSDMVVGIEDQDAAFRVVPTNTILSGDIVAKLGNPITYVMELQAPGSADSITVPNPNASIFDTIMDVNGADFLFEYQGVGSLMEGDSWQVLFADEFTGPLGSISATGLPGIYNVDSSRLLIDGTISLVFAPEPASVALWGLVAAMAAGTAYRVRRKRAA